jgi:ribose transport system substrate-binding protein
MANGQSDASASGEKKLKIGYTVQSMENAYFVSVVEGMKVAAKDMGIDLIVADAAADASKHVAHIENFIAQQVDVILISPVDEKAPEDAVANAQAQGIPVIGINQTVKGSSAFIGTSEYDFGYNGGIIAGQWLNEKEAAGTISDVLNKKGEIEVVVIRYDVIASLIDRGDGLKAGMEETYTGSAKFDYVFEQDAADADTGYKVAETALTANPNVAIFLGINDSSALGVYEACLARKNHTINNTCITGLDALPQALELIAGDTMYQGTVDIQPAKLGRDALEIAMKVLADGPIKEKILIDMKIVTDANIGEYIK